MRSPFSLYKYESKAGTVWYVRLLDQETGEVYATRSTGILVSGKKGRRIAA